MTITAKVVAHSRVDVGVPDLITLQLRYPRFIHAEAKTHRLIRIDDAEYEFLQEVSFMDDENLSRNASSSRAIPVERMIQDVIDDPAMPVRWGANQPGMQDAGDHDAPVAPYYAVEDADVGSPKDAWVAAGAAAVAAARNFAAAGYHKQVVNRLLEPFGHISVVCTATDWDNFFDLRCHPDADPTMRALAEAMLDAIAASKPKALCRDEWHLPYVTAYDQDALHDRLDVPQGQGLVHGYLAMISAARCARVSYLNHDGTAPDIVKDLALADRLLASKHMSPFEHQARPWNNGVYKPYLSGNFKGWYQHRKIVEAQQS